MSKNKYRVRVLETLVTGEVNCRSQTTTRGPCKAVAEYFRLRGDWALASNTRVVLDQVGSDQPVRWDGCMDVPDRRAILLDGTVVEVDGDVNLGFPKDRTRSRNWHIRG